MAALRDTQNLTANATQSPVQGITLPEEGGKVSVNCY